MDDRTLRLRTVRAAARELGLSDDGLRDVYVRTIGSRSAAGASAADLGRVLDALRAAGWVPKSRRRKGDRRPAGSAQARKIRALWVSAHNLGITYDPSETGLGEWIERQTGISAMNWVDPATLAKVIEALKFWIAREGGVDWPPADAGPLAARRAVIEAQLRRGGQLAAEVDIRRMGASELDAIIGQLGVEVRRRRAA
ncbi:regulatory protein GemA [Tistrella mobilis]|uniref:Mu-like prophage protein GP16 n=1 Tax=Tistrella mobilis (strain KA081020-065) TaxID=1110502 RepID=I3TN92_TISMK|nr:regulatory protein GemA [Tistrella mobilis]AFK54230.1 Mu-like prophage protein GP16 [Tistrella mobilis KA081020-065]